MATQVQFRRGTTTQNNAFTGAIGEITYDTEVKTLRLHDGSTAGGGSVVTINAGAQTLTNKTMSTNSVWQGTAVGLAYGGTNANITAAAGAVVYSTASALGVTSAGTSGQVLTSAGSSAPSWTSQSSLTVGTATTATTATNIAGGSAGQLIIQQDTNLSTFISAGASGTILQSQGAGYAPTWVTSDITIGSTSISVGATSTSLAGLTSINATSGATSFFATPTSPVVFAAATSLTLGYGSTASSTTNISTGAVGSGNTKTINIGTGGAAGSTTNINLGDADGGTVTVNKDLVVSGDLTVNGTTTTINSTTLDVDDINITVAKGAANAAAANGAGLTVDGASATILYTSATDSWNFNKPLIASNTDYWKVPAGNNAARPGSAVNGMIRYNSEISAFEGYAASAWSSLGGVKSVDGYTYILAETSAGAGNGDLDFYAENAGGTAGTQVGQWNRTNLKDYTGTLVGTQTTQNVFNATATTVNAFGASTALTIGATTGTATIRNATVSITNDATVGGTLGVTGNTTLSGTLELGHASDTTLARSAAGVVTIEGVEIVTLSRSQTLTNKTLTLPTIGGTGAVFNGSTSGTTTVLASATAGTTTITLPATTGTVVTTGDSGTVTSTMIADGTIVNADINASAAIAVSKLAASTISGVTLGSNLNSLTAGTGLSGTAYNGSAAQTWTLATSGVTAASYGSSTLIPVLTVDAYGRITSATTSSVQGGQYFGSASTKAISYNSNSIDENITVTSGNNGLSAGPITISSGYTVTVASGATWTVV